VRLLLDTAVLIWATESPARLSKRAASALARADNVLELSAVSLSEIAIKTSLGRFRFSPPDLRQALSDLGVGILPYRADHAFSLFDLPLHHKDPFDRQIIAQALVEQMPVVTPDDKFGLYEGLRVIW
jgi:PIN domain nuclease of toxin-antitoxin system